MQFWLRLINYQTYHIWFFYKMDPFFIKSANNGIFYKYEYTNKTKNIHPWALKLWRSILNLSKVLWSLVVRRENVGGSRSNQALDQLELDPDTGETVSCRYLWCITSSPWTWESFAKLNLSVLLSGKVVRLRTREGNTVPVSLTVRKLVDTSRVMVLLEPVTRWLDQPVCSWWAWSRESMRFSGLWVTSLWTLKGLFHQLIPKQKLFSRLNCVKIVQVLNLISTGQRRRMLWRPCRETASWT